MANVYNNSEALTQLKNAVNNLPTGSNNSNIDIATNDKPGIVRASNEVINILSEKTYDLIPMHDCGQVHYRWTGGDIEFIKDHLYLIKLPEGYETNDTTIEIWQDDEWWTYMPYGLDLPLNEIFKSYSSFSFKEWGANASYGYTVVFESESKAVPQLIIQEIEYISAPDWKISVDPVTGEMSVNTVLAKNGTPGLIDLNNISMNYPTTTKAGIVKSGGDVTISNGIISVNDNSHKHSISNISDINTKLATNDSLGFVKGKANRRELVTPLYVMNWCGSYNWYGEDEYGWSSLSLTPGTRYIVTHTSGPARRPMSLGEGWNGYIEVEGLFTDTVFTVDEYYSNIAIYDTELDSNGWMLYEVLGEITTGDITINDDGTMKANVPLTETSLSLKDAITGELYTITIENGQIKATKA